MTEVIGEAGLNHKGKLSIAKKMVEAACIADADAIKFQTYETACIVHKNDKSYATLNHLSLSRHEFLELARFCSEMEIEFLSTPGDLGSLRFLIDECGIKRIKIGSDDLTYFPLLEAAADTKLPVILSTGMATMGEVANALKVFSSIDDITLLHCVSLYPCPFELANLRCIRSMLTRFNMPIGYSDHVPGTLASLAAAAIGASIIEKHFMLDEHSDCVDKEVSINEIALTSLVASIRIIDLMRGDGFKYPSPQEAANSKLFRKQLDGLRPLSA